MSKEARVRVGNRTFGPRRDTTIRRTLVPAGLTLLAVVQLVLLVGSDADAGLPASPLATGKVLPDIRVRHADGDRRRLGSGGAVLVLVFDPGCVHSRRIAHAWREWLEGVGAGTDVLALSAADPSESAEHAKDSGWSVPVVSVDAGVPGSPEQALTKRTPWVFALDADGTILAEGHGASISEVAAVLPQSTVPESRQYANIR